MENGGSVRIPAIDLARNCVRVKLQKRTPNCIILNYFTGSHTTKSIFTNWYKLQEKKMLPKIPSYQYWDGSEGQSSDSDVGNF